MLNSFSRRLRALWNAYFPLFFLVVLWSLVLAGYAIARHERLNSSGYDLAIKAQVIWNTLQGRWFDSSIEVQHYLGDHVQLVFLLIAPLFALWSDVKVLLLLQAIVLSLGALPLYRTAWRWTADRWLALLFAAAYLLFPLIGFVNRFDFHPLVFTIPLFLLAYDLLESDRPNWASLVILLSLALREDVGFTVFAFGLYVAVFMKRRALGLIWAGVGLSWSFVAAFSIIPYFRGAASDTLQRYAWLGDSPVSILEAILTRPGAVLSQLTHSPREFLTIVKLLLPLGFVALLAPAPLLVTLPALAYNMLSAIPSQSSIYFQYLAPIVPFIFIAAVQGAARVQKWLARDKARWVLTTVIGLGTLLAWLWDNPFTKTINSPYYEVYGLERIIERAPFDQAKALLPPEASVATMMAYAPHLALRPDLKIFYDPTKPPSGPYGLPEAQYYLLNLTDLRWKVNARIFYDAIQTAIGRLGYEAIYAQDDVVLLQRTDQSNPLTGAVLGRVIDLYEGGGKYAPTDPEPLSFLARQWVSSQPPQGISPRRVSYAEGINLIGFEMPVQRQAGQPLCVTLYWQAETAVTDNYTIFMHLAAPDGYVQAQRDSDPVFGYYPTDQWQAGELIADMHCLRLPPGLAPGAYDLLVGIYDPDDGQRLVIQEGSDREDNAALLGRITITNN